jgi:dihydrofolate synthase/folylpolyglutamate synthase
MKDIREYFKYLYALERSSMKYDLKNISILLEAIGNPHHDTKYIHIAGTNGKGAVASFVSSIFTEYEFNTGLFTSPHILRFNERIRINGKTIPDSYIKNFLDKNKKLIGKVKPSIFEVNTAIALKYFSDKKVDLAVIESGLGGRLDSTNIIAPQLIIITQIGIDHTDYLGNTLVSIAKEKMGIIKPGTDVIVSDTNKELRNLFIKKVSNEHLFLLDRYVKYKILKKENGKTKFETGVILNNKKNNFKFTSPLLGLYQVRNFTTALLASMLYFNKLGLNINANKLQKALHNIKINTGYRGRFETLKLNGVNYILDISHNPSGIETALSNFTPKMPDVIVFAIMNDKDYKTASEKIVRTKSKIIFTKPIYKRALDAKILYDYACSFRFADSDKMLMEPNVNRAIKLAGNIAGRNGNVLIIGSFFLVSESIKALKIQHLFK